MSAPNSCLKRLEILDFWAVVNDGHVIFPVKRRAILIAGINHSQDIKGSCVLLCGMCSCVRVCFFCVDCGGSFGVECWLFKVFMCLCLFLCLMCLILCGLCVLCFGWLACECEEEKKLELQDPGWRGVLIGVVLAGYELTLTQERENCPAVYLRREVENQSSDGRHGTRLQEENRRWRPRARLGTKGVIICWVVTPDISGFRVCSGSHMEPPYFPLHMTI